MKRDPEVIAVGTYNEYKWLCNHVKMGETKALNEAAELLAPFVSKDDTLVPVPSRYGRATYTFMLAMRLAYKTGCEVENCLKGEVRASLCDTKRAGGEIKPPKFRKCWKLPRGKRYVLLDNVYDTGTTCRAAANALKNKCSMLVIAKTNYGV